MGQLLDQLKSLAGIAGGNGHKTKPVGAETLAVLPEIAETLTVTKRQITGAGYRIQKTVETTEERVQATLREQTLSVDRFAVNKPVIDGVIPSPRQEGDVWIIPIVKEVLVTETRLMLVEEIHVTRRQTTREHEQAFPVRHERIVVTPLDAPDKP